MDLLVAYERPTSTKLRITEILPHKVAHGTLGREAVWKAHVENGPKGKYCPSEVYVLA